MEKPRIERQYDHYYSKIDTDLSKESGPTEVVSKIPNYVTSGEVLDIGAGSGKNALWLGRQGFRVRAQDISEVGVETINKISQAEELQVEATKSDVREGIQDEYDVIVSTNLLHFLDPEEAMGIIEQMKDHTRPGGLNVIMSFTKEGEFLQITPHRFFLEPNELKDIYKGWEILEYDETSYETRGRREDGSRMVNTSASMIARKP